jgi:RimJ/RimL family protein N-acetyltransferase
MVTGIVSSNTGTWSVGYMKVGLEDKQGLLHLRPATSTDMQMIFDWVNSPSSIQNKLKTTEPIPLMAHQSWFNARLDNVEANIWIVEDESHPVGQVRAECEGDLLMVDIFIAPELRGRGYGRLALQMLLRECQKWRPALPVMAVIKKQNSPSLSLFQRVGFREISSDDQVVSMIYEGISKNTPFSPSS